MSEYMNGPDTLIADFPSRTREWGMGYVKKHSDGQDLFAGERGLIWCLRGQRSGWLVYEAWAGACVLVSCGPGLEPGRQAQHQPRSLLRC